MNILRTLAEQSRVNHFWNIMPAATNAYLTYAWNKTPQDVASLLESAWKYTPNIPELVKGATITSVGRVALSFTPVEQAIKNHGDNPALWGVVRNTFQIATTAWYRLSGDQIGSTGIKYQELHTWAAIDTTAIKVAMIGNDIYQNGMNSTSLAATTIQANYISEIPARGLYILVDKKKGLNKDGEINTIDFIKENGEYSWGIETFVGASSRMYVSSKVGKFVSQITGIHKIVAESGNDLELSLIRFIKNDQTISFESKDTTSEKFYQSITVSNLNSEDNYTDTLLKDSSTFFEDVSVGAVLLPVEFLTRFIPEVALGPILVSATRVTADIFQEGIKYMVGNPTHTFTPIKAVITTGILAAAAYEFVIDPINNWLVNDLPKDIGSELFSEELILFYAPQLVVEENTSLDIVGSSSLTAVIEQEL